MLFLVSLSLIVHLIVPGGDCKLAVPLKTLLSTLAVTRLGPEMTFRVVIQPVWATLPVPV